MWWATLDGRGVGGVVGNMDGRGVGVLVPCMCMCMYSTCEYRGTHISALNLWSLII